VNLYRGNTKKFKTTVKGYLETVFEFAKETSAKTTELQKVLQSVAGNSNLKKFNGGLFEKLNHLEDFDEVLAKQNQLIADIAQATPDIEVLENIAHQCKAIRKPQDKFIKQIPDTIADAVKEQQLNKNKDWKELNLPKDGQAGLKEQLDKLKDLQQQLSGNPNEEEPGLLHETEYYWKQAHWLTSRFPDGVYTDVEGLCKVVTQTDIEAKDWSLSPGRYVGVSLSEVEDFDYEERLQEIHIELEGLNEEAIKLASMIGENYKSLL
jgi:type I restriction enzyme M protein